MQDVCVQWGKAKTLEVTVSLAQWSLKDLCWEQGDTELQCTRIYQTHHDCWQAGELHRFPAMIPRNPYSDSLGVEKSNLSISPGLQSILKLFTWVGILRRTESLSPCLPFPQGK